jgi:hypothetical protein
MNPYHVYPLRTFSFGLSVAAAGLSAVPGLLLPYPFPELISLVFLLLASGSIALILLAGVAIGLTLFFGDNYFIFSFLLLAAVVIAVLEMPRLELFLQRPSIRQLIVWIIGINIIVMCVQFLSPNLAPEIPYVTLGDGGRAAGLKQEPSHAVIYVALCATLAMSARPGRRQRAAILFMVIAIFMFLVTKSELVALVTLSYIMLYFARRLPWYLTGLALVAFLAVFIGNLTEINRYLFEEMGSWRSVPDIVMLLDPGSFLLPQLTEGQEAIRNAIDRRFQTTTFISWTYSLFATAVLTLGYIPLILLLLWMYFGKRGYMRQVISVKAFPIFLSALFFIPKYETLNIVLMLGAIVFARQTAAGRAEQEGAGTAAAGSMPQR